MVPSPADAEAALNPVNEEAAFPGFSALYVVQPEKFLLVACCYLEVLS